MRFFIALAATAALLAPVAATAADRNQQTFTRDGDTYVYVTDTRADGARVIRGRQLGGVTFRLVVVNGRVQGTTDGRPVSFRVSDAVTQPVVTAAN